MTKTPYPLEEILGVKKRRVDTARKAVKAAQEALDKEKEKLLAREKERDEALEHYRDKLKQIRQTMDRESHTDKITQMRSYLKMAQEKLIEEEEKVKKQKEEVKKSEKLLEEAQEKLFEKRREEDKIIEHRKEWLKITAMEERREDTKELDEIGSSIFLSRYHRNKNR